jgi:hypothetical protein
VVFASSVQVISWDFVFNGLSSALFLMMAVILVYLDHVQSVVLSALVGISVSIYARNPVDGRLWSAGIFLLLQVTFYLLMLVIGLFLLPLIFRLAGWTGPGAEISRSVVMVMLFYLGREFIIRLLWDEIAYRLNADRSEARQILA